jgi:prepilin-type processing-associated H-X9-DG protein
MRTKESTAQTFREASAAFTLTELLVVVGVLAILALTMVSALGRSQPQSRTALCQNNLKQLAVAWQMYAEDYSGRIVPNFQGAYLPGPTGAAGWVSGWLDWSTSSQNTNVYFLIDARYAALASYINGASNLFKCPADHYLSSQQRSRGWLQRVRSYSLNAYVGENVPLGQPGGPSGPPIYRQTRKISEFLHPAPAEVAVFIEEHPDSMNDPAFLSPNQTTWIDSPGTYHNGAATFAFADGHTEVRHWRGSLATGPATRVSYMYINNYSAPAGDEDIRWMSYHTPRISALSY